MNRLAPGVPPDYYDSIYAIEEAHWWHLGMRRITATLLGDRLTEPGLRVLDVGCGTGGFLRFVLDGGSPGRACGVDVSSAAIDLARTRVPEAELHVAPAWDLPLDSAGFDLVVANDVLQHLPEDHVDDAIVELRRVAADGGALLVRTNGARRLRRERADWRAYDRQTLVKTLERGGFRCERATYVNLVPSFWALARGHVPRAPTEHSHGVARTIPPRLPSAVASGLLAAEARYLAQPPRSLSYGHTLFAVAVAA
jgi:ubiquinone/menaquinone biosynthesis C-methylase UbiE